MFGGFIAEVANKTGVIETLTTALRRAAEGFQILSNFTSNGGGSALARMIFKPWQDIGGGNNFDTVKSSLALALKSGVQTPVDREAAEAAFSRAKGRGGRVSGGAGASGGGGGSRRRHVRPADACAEWANASRRGPAAPTADQQAAMARAAAEAARKQIEIHDKAMADIERLGKEMATKLAAQTHQFARGWRGHGCGPRQQPHQRARAARRRRREGRREDYRQHPRRAADGGRRHHRQPAVAGHRRRGRLCARRPLRARAFEPPQMPGRR